MCVDQVTKQALRITKKLIEGTKKQAKNLVRGLSVLPSKPFLLCVLIIHAHTNVNILLKYTFFLEVANKLKQVLIV